MLTVRSSKLFDNFEGITSVFGITLSELTFYTCDAEFENVLDTYRYDNLVSSPYRFCSSWKSLRYDKGRYISTFIVILIPII